MMSLEESVPAFNTSSDVDEYLRLLDQNETDKFNEFFSIDDNLMDFTSFDWYNSTLVNNTMVLYILGLFELSTKYGERVQGISEKLAAELAVQHVNHLNVLPGYQIKMLINDTKV